MDKPVDNSIFNFVNNNLPNALPVNWHHQLFYDILDNKVTQKENGLLTLNGLPNKTNKNILVLAPRFHSKSICFTVNYPLYEITKNPNIRILIVSANEDIAVSFNRAIMNQLENNKNLLDNFGDLVPRIGVNKKWGEKALVVKRKVTAEVGPTVTAMGVGGKLISRRADIIICDDIIDIDTARTKSMRLKTKEWFENVLLPILEPEGRLVVGGTAWYNDDIYDNLWKESQFDIRLKLKALAYHPKYFRGDRNNNTWMYLPYSPTDYPLSLDVGTIFDDSVISKYHLYTRLKKGVLWPEKWDFPTLMDKKKNMSRAAFTRQYLNEATSEEEKLFKDKHLQKAKNRGEGRNLLQGWDNSDPLVPSYGHLIVAIGVDLALSKSSSADDTAISVWGLNDKRDRILLYLDYGKFSPEETKMKLVELNHAFSPVKIMVESIAFQDMMRQELLAEDIPVEGFRTTSGNKFNEETGISHMAMLFEQEKVIIPHCRENKESSDKIKRLMYDFITYTQDQHAGDTLMSSWFAFEALREFDKRLRSTSGFFSQASLIEMLRNKTASRRVVILGLNPPFYKFSPNSLLHIFRPMHFFPEPTQFIQPDEKFLIYITRRDMTVGYIFAKLTSEIVGKIEGDITATQCCNMLERIGKFFNNAQLIFDRTGEGDALYLEMQKRFYPHLICLQPDKDGRPVPGEGFSVTSSILPLAVDFCKSQVDSQMITIPDDRLIKEMAEVVGVNGDKLEMGYGSGQRLMTVSMGLWLLENYENMEKKSANKPKNINKKTNVPYLVFNY